MISFIVPAYNEERLLGATLTSLHTAAQALGERYEIVVADDASTDRTAEIARAHGAVVVTCAYRQISATRNAGAAAALGDRFVFVDADTRIDAAVLRAALQALRDGAVGGGAPVRFDGVVPWYARLLLPLVVLAFRVARLAAGCFLFCTRSAFVATGGFDTTLYAAEEARHEPQPQASGSLRDPARGGAHLGTQAAHALGARAAGTAGAPRAARRRGRAAARGARTLVRGAARRRLIALLSAPPRRWRAAATPSWPFATGTAFTYGTTTDGPQVVMAPRQTSNFVGVRYVYRFQ